MDDSTVPVTRRTHRSAHLPSYVWHPAFDLPTARKEFAPAAVLASPADWDDRYMPDEVTRDHTKRMHHAAHRMHKARTPADLRRWTGHYLALRDQVVLGNRKLIYRAVRRRMAVSNRADDMIGDCHIVLIQAVAAFNPWLGIRFSTYAYTCLVRALARMSQRLATDWLARSLPLDALPDGEPGGGSSRSRRPAGRSGWTSSFGTTTRSCRPGRSSSWSAGSASATTPGTRLWRRSGRPSG